MSKYLVFNIQLLPLNDVETPEVGQEGYLKLFSLLNQEVTSTLKARALLSTAMSLVHDTFFAPLNSRESNSFPEPKGQGKKPFVIGQFIKFTKADFVEDLYTRKTLFQQTGEENAISGRREFSFIFNPETHWIAIENKNGRLPSPHILINALERFFGPIVGNSFPKYTLTVNLVSRRDELFSVLDRAKGFSRIEVELTFKNGPTGDQVLDDFAASRLHKLHLKATAARGGLMPKVPETIEGIVHNVPNYGSASIGFVEEVDGKRVRSTYQSENSPETIVARASRKEEPENFYKRVNTKIVALAKKVGHLLI